MTLAYVQVSTYSFTITIQSFQIIEYIPDLCKSICDQWQNKISAVQLKWDFILAMLTVIVTQPSLMLADIHGAYV